MQVVVDGPTADAGGQARAGAGGAARADARARPSRADDVAAGLWGRWSRPTGALDALVERVRAESTGPALEAGPDGLRLVVDAARRRRPGGRALVALAGDQAADQQPWEALDAVERALALWRGPVLSGVEDVPFARPVVERLAELRARLVEERFELLFRLDRHAEVIDELREATREHPTRERLWGQLMTALHREHRTQEALEVYADARAVLADELGIEPGEALQRLEAAILLEDPARDPALADHPMPRAAARLPVPRTPTFGRDELVEQRGAQPAGSRHPAGHPHRARRHGQDPGGRRWRRPGCATTAGGSVYFHEVTERETADDVVAAVDGMVARARRRDRGRRRTGPLVVLDNVDACPDGRPTRFAAPRRDPVARAAGHRPGAAAAGGGARRRGAAAGGAAPVGARRPRSRRARLSQLFLRIARQADPRPRRRRPGGRSWPRCAGCSTASPLALELAAARVRLLGLAGLRDSLESGLELLRTTAPDVPERQRALASTIAWSHDRLGDASRRLCRRLVVFGQAFTLEAVEAVAADLGDVIERPHPGDGGRADPARRSAGCGSAS